MTALDAATEVCDCFRAALTFEQTGQFPEASAAFDRASRFLSEFAAEVNRQLDDARVAYEDESTPLG